MALPENAITGTVTPPTGATLSPAAREIVLAPNGKTCAVRVVTGDPGQVLHELVTSTDGFTWAGSGVIARLKTGDTAVTVSAGEVRRFALDSTSGCGLLFAWS
jgi:hypothetical protein